MAVEMASQLPLGVIEVEDLEALQADDRLKFLECLSVSLRGAQFISCRKGMTGIEAYPYPLRLSDHLDDAGQLLEGVAQVGTLASSGLQQGHYLKPGSSPVDRIQPLRNSFQPCLLARAKVRPRVHVHVRHTQRLTALQLAYERVH